MYSFRSTADAISLFGPGVPRVLQFAEAISEVHNPARVLAPEKRRVGLVLLENRTPASSALSFMLNVSGALETMMMLPLLCLGTVMAIFVVVAVIFVSCCEQEGIAKGVRRIVGVTRGMALSAIERSRAFEAQLDSADGIEGLALDAEVLGFT